MDVSFAKESPANASAGGDMMDETRTSVGRDEHEQGPGQSEPRLELPQAQRRGEQKNKRKGKERKGNYTYLPRIFCSFGAVPLADLVINFD